jgi:hypothetical protein
MIKRFLLTALFLLFTQISFSYEQTDSMCLSECTQSGFSYPYCSKKCSFDTDNNSGGFTLNSDIRCLKECYRDDKTAEECKEMCN